MLLLHLGLLLARVQRVAIYFCVVDDSRILIRNELLNESLANKLSMPEFVNVHSSSAAQVDD